MRALLVVAAGFGAAFVAAQPLACRVATWNLQNFLVGNRFETGQFRYAYPMPEARKQRIRARIIQQHPDILFLQEIGSRAFLTELQLDLRAGGIDYPFAGFSARPGARSGLAFLSTVPPVSVIFHDPVPFAEEAEGSIRRGIQEVTFSIRGERLRVFHVHLKSRYTSDPLDPDSRRFRQLEIASLSRFLGAALAAQDDQPLVLLGDFNTPFSSPLLQPLRRHWMPLPVCDSSGSSETYFHHSGSAELIDGFWVPRSADSLFFPGEITPSSDDDTSDHRLVSAFFLFRLLPPS